MMSLGWPTGFIAAAAVALAGCASTASVESAPLVIADDIDGFVSEALEDIGLPVGLGVAIYTDAGAYVRGFGLADAATNEPATADTAFYIASSTKSFVALAMNVLHHRGEIDLDAALSDYAPEAPFPAAVHPDEVTLRELLTHTSGVSNEPIAFRSAFSGEHTPQGLWTLLGSSTINEDAPHGVFEYTNTGYNILTLLTDRKLGVDWRDLIAREIVTPSGMTRTTAYMSRANRENWSVARPHAPALDGRTQQRLYLEKVDATMQSGGGMVMSANDALIWLELLINDGRVSGRQILPAEAVRETRAPMAEVDQTFNDYVREDYGLGWYVGRYGEDPMIHHFGGFAGFRAHVSYLPERRNGVAVFANDSVVGSFLVDAIANYAYDRLAGRIPAGRAARAGIILKLRRQYDEIVSSALADRANREHRAWTFSLPLPAYVGRYEHPGLGTLIIRREDGALTAQLGIMHAQAEPFPVPDSIRVEMVPLSGDTITFEVDAGEVVAASALGARFERTPDQP